MREKRRDRYTFSPASFACLHPEADGYAGISVVTPTQFIVDGE